MQCRRAGYPGLGAWFSFFALALVAFVFLCALFALTDDDSCDITMGRTGVMGGNADLSAPA